MTHNKKEKFDHIFYCVFWAFFFFFKPVVTLVQWLLLWVWCENRCFLYFFLNSFNGFTSIYLLFYMWYRIAKSARIHVCLSSWVQQSLQQSDKSCVLGLVCCSPLKITFMLPACSPRFNLSLDKVRKAFYRGEIHISARFCHCNDCDSGWQHWNVNEGHNLAL